MYLIFIIPMLYGSSKFADINHLNRSLKPFLDVNDSIKYVDDDIYKFFNGNVAHIKVSSADRYNTLEIKSSNKRANILPSCLERLINIHVLVLAENNLAELPQYFTKFTLLETLTLSSNNFTKFPEVLFSLKNLANLQLKDNNIVSIDDNIEILEYLNVLDLSGNDIKSVSGNLKNLKSLAYLDLSYNMSIIRNIDDVINFENDISFWGKIPSSVAFLYLNNIGLGYIPEDFNLPRLSIVELSYNFLSDLPQSFGECSNICMFNVSFNNLITIPSCIYQMKQLRRLKLNNNDIKSPFFLEKNMLSTLKKLDMTSCAITKFDIDGYDVLYYNTSTNNYTQLEHLIINELKPLSYLILTINHSKPAIVNSLEFLSLSITNVSIVPKLLIFPNLVSLKLMNLDDTDVNPQVIRSFFSGLAKMQTLKNLELFGFNFLTVPSKIFTLNKLQFLSLNLCRIEEIQDEILTIPNLKTINLHCNSIITVNPKIFTFHRTIEFALYQNPFEYLPSEINNNNSNFKLEIDGKNLAHFKKDDYNLGSMDISYKKVHQIIGYNLFNNFTMSIEDIYNKARNGDYRWELDKMLKIKNKEVTEYTKDYRDILDYWNILEDYISDANTKKTFLNYLEILYGIKRKRREIISNQVENIKNSIKTYAEAVFEILINLFKTGNTENIEPIIMAIEPGLSVCVDGQLQHFSYAYHLLIGDYDESNSIEYFIKNRIALLKYDALREITTSNIEEQNIHTFLHWQRELSETLGLPFFHKHYEMDTKNIFLKCKEYILYQFFKLMNVKNVVNDLIEHINKVNKTITLASQYIYDKLNDRETPKDCFEYEGDIEELKITSITEKGVYFILEDMGLIKKVEK